ncbi:hypothetical protein B0H16DRAFT_605201 [Mycena metata]|uniref:Uncharacterized protein n=1 Tax=Mycena metata TaxID=1033252 RepID=A0AAD7NYC8_9AGAR|nr:hypothetical protein B0H16DRAFT_605201 [Mycena metata]
MSSQNIPPQLQLSIPPTSFKRSFEQFGFDLESPSAVPHSHDPIDGTSTTSASSSSTRGQEGDENRRKRARSASSLSDPEDRSSDASSSTLSSFSASTSADSDSLSHSSSSQTAARRHLLLDLGLGRGLGSSVALGLGMAAAELQLGSSEPPPRIPTPELLDNEDVDMPDIDLSGFSPPVQHEEEPASPAEHVRRSVDRFNAFERHISVLRSSSPPVIPLPSSLTSRQASLSPPTLPPLPLVELGLDPQDGESEDEHEHIPSTVTTNTTASTPPRLDLNFPPTTSLSSPGPSSSRVATAESATQFRERLDSAIDGLGGGDLNFEAPSLLPIDRPEPELDRHFQRLRESLATSSTASNASGSSSASASAPRTRPSVESPLFEWAPTTLDWNITLNPTRASGSEAGQVPSLSPWRAHFRPPGAAAVADTAPDRSRYSPPYQPPRLYPRPASLAAPLSVPATTSSLDGLDVDLVDAYLDSVRVNSTNTRAWESALDRARTMRVQRERERQEEREREREREQTRERLRERERAREREREEESERERDHPWSLDSIWETGGAESLSSARPRPWESLTSSQTREGVSPIDWLGQMEERDDGRTQLDLFDEWLSSA